MNLPTASSPAAASCDRPGARKDADAREPRDPRACNAFAQVLLMRQRQQRDDDDDQEPPAESPLLPTLATSSPSQASAVPPRSAAGALDAAPTGTRAVVETSLRETPCPQTTPRDGGDAAMAWEVSVHEPNSVALEMRAVRAERSGAAEGHAGWGLTIASSSVGAEVLARHAPRLNERLRKHAIGPEHVRIEQTAEDDR